MGLRRKEGLNFLSTLSAGSAIMQSFNYVHGPSIDTVT